MDENDLKDTSLEDTPGEPLKKKSKIKTESEMKSLKKENIVHEPSKCQICSATFRFPSAYIKHYQDTHGSIPPEYIDKETFVCDQCPMVFISGKNLKEHIERVHLRCHRYFKNTKVIKFQG